VTAPSLGTPPLIWKANLMSETAAHVEEPLARGGRTIFGHPIGLANLFGVELWERFSFYGMVTILAYYLYYSVERGGLELPQTTATGLVGAYGGLVYLSTVLGSWLADRVFGMERTVLYGGFVVMAGHVALALVPGLAGVGIGLVLVAVGAGALKANASSLLGMLYPKGDPRCDGGFTLFYLGINIGSFFGPLLTGALSDVAGFHIAFGAAAIGMAFGLTQYVVFRRNLGDAGRTPGNPLPAEARGKAIGVVVLGLAVIAAAVFSGLLTLANLAQVATGVVVLATIAYFVVMLNNPKVTGVERRRVLAFIPMFIAIAAFWSLFQQIFTALAVYSDERMDWNIFGWTAPSSYLLLVETIWVMPLSLVLSGLWTRLGTRAPSTPVKLSLGVIITGVGYLLFLTMAGGTGKTSPALVVLFILLLFAVAELLVSPIGLSVSTKLAPTAYRAQMMALYFFAPALGSSLSGVLAKFYSPLNEVAYFGLTGGVAVVIGLCVLAASPWTRRHMEGVH
jgi:proton-dependent oligopeptide transporter, POT family